MSPRFDAGQDPPVRSAPIYVPELAEPVGWVSLDPQPVPVACVICGYPDKPGHACPDCKTCGRPPGESGRMGLCSYCAELASLEQGTYPASACWRCKELNPGPHICPAPPGTQLTMPRDRRRLLKLGTLAYLIAAAIVSADVRSLAWIAPMTLIGVALALVCAWERDR